MTFSMINLMIIAVILVVFGRDVVADVDCLMELKKVKFDETVSGYINLRRAVPPEFRFFSNRCDKYPDYKTLVSLMSEKKILHTKLYSEYSNGYYNHLLKFCEYEELMQSPATWCTINDCLEMQRIQDYKFSYGNEIDTKYFNSIAKNVDLQEQKYPLCTLYVCHAEIRSLGEEKVEIIGFPRKFTVQQFKFNQPNRLHLIRTTNSFCAAEICYSELALAGFQDRKSAVINKRNVLPLIKSKPHFVEKLKGYAKGYLDYLENFDDGGIEDTDKFNFDDYYERQFSSEQSESSRTRIIGLESDHYDEINYSSILTVNYVNKYGLPMYEWCLIEVCLRQLVDGGFVHEMFVFNFKKVFLNTDPSSLKFEFAIKYYEYIKRMVNHQPIKGLPADAKLRDRFDWCKLTVLWF